RKWDKDRATAMIQAIDKMLKTRRIMRNLESQNQRDLPRDIPLVSVEVLRYDIKMSKCENMGIVPTEVELILEQTQQGISHEVSVRLKGLKNEKEM
nr:hypothetical protein [Tanacetum cinerariifolium]